MFIKMRKNFLVIFSKCLIFYFIFASATAIYINEFDAKGICPNRTEIIYPCMCVNGTSTGVIIKCEQVNLATLSIAMQNLANMDLTLAHIYIVNGQFVRLYGPLFAKITAKMLSIVDTPLQTVEDYALFGINNTLEEIHFIHTNLTSITSLSFGILGKLRQLEIDGHFFETLDKKMFVEQPVANSIETLRITNGPLKDLPIETFQPLHKLKVLDLHGNQFINLKRNQFKNLRNLEVLDISFNSLLKLEAHHISDLTKLGWCNVSHNALTEISRGVFARNSVLKVLNMSFNNISSLDVSSFRGMRFLRRLYMSDNRISEIGRGTFGSVAKIGTVDLARNQLKKIEFQMFSQLNYVEIIDVAENNISVVEKNAFKDVYQALINISYNSLEKIEPKAFINCVNITKLDLTHNFLKNIRTAFDETTFATELLLSYNQFSNLTQVSLNNMTALKIFNISHNLITEIPKNFFPKLYELHTIDFSHNNISRSFNGVFKPLFSLRLLDFSYNNFRDLPSPVFGPLPTLNELNLSFNKLETISRSALVKLTSLRYLNINNNRLNKLFQIPISLNELRASNNDLHEINKEAWPLMNSLLYLDLSNNYIGDSLGAGTFKGLLVLQKLYLNSNNISRAPAESLRDLTSLQYLHLESNNITTIDKDAFGKLPVLFELNLCGNNITDISKRAFEGLLQLITLNMSRNSIKEIPNDAFIGLPSLRSLDLSYNYLVKLDNKTNGVIDNLLSLENLNLSHNRFNFLTKKTLPSNKYIPYNIRHLDLSYNQIAVMTYDFTFGTKKLNTLNLAHNHITEIRKRVLSNLTSLIELDLSNNELTDLESDEHVFDLPRNLTRLYLANNPLFKIPFEQLNKQPSLEVIDLRNNSFNEFPINIVWNLRNGSQVLLEGNPLHCNCAIRPIKHVMMQKNDIKKKLEHLICKTPSNLNGLPVKDIPDENLECNAEERTNFEGAHFEELPDVRFRGLQLLADKLEVSWFVLSNRDVADFSIIIRNSQNKVLHRATVLYNVRSIRIPLSELSTDKSKLSSAEVCIVSMNSNFSSNRWFSSQCKSIQSFKSAKKSLFYKKGKSEANHSSTVSYVIYLFLLILHMNLNY